MGATHPVISKIAEKIFGRSLSEITGESTPGVLIPEIETREYDQLEESPTGSLSFLGDVGGNGRWSAEPSRGPRFYSSPVRSFGYRTGDIDIDIGAKQDRA